MCFGRAFSQVKRRIDVGAGVEGLSGSGFGNDCREAGGV